MVVASPQNSPPTSPAVSALCTTSGVSDILNHFQTTEFSWVRKEHHAPQNEWYQNTPRKEFSYIDLHYVASVNREVSFSSCQSSAISTVAQEIQLATLGGGTSGGFGACGTGRTTTMGWAKKPYTSGVDATGLCRTEGNMNLQKIPGGYSPTAGFDTSGSVAGILWELFAEIKTQCPDFRMDLLNI